MRGKHHFPRAGQLEQFGVGSPVVLENVQRADLNAIDPADDMDTINTELALADLESIEKQLYKAERSAKTNDKVAIANRDALRKVKAHLDEGRPVRSLELSETERGYLDGFHLLTAKPVMYIANVDERGFENNPHLDLVRKLAESESSVVVPVCAAIEAEIAQLEDADKADFLADLGLEEPGLDRVIRCGYQLLGLDAAAEDDLDSRWSHIDAAGEHAEQHRQRVSGTG